MEKPAVYSHELKQMTTKKTKRKPAKKAPKAATKMTVEALAKAMKVTAKTIRLLRKTQGAPPENDVEEWTKYMMHRASASGQTMKVSDAFMPEEIQNLRAKLLRAQAGKEDAVRRLKELELKRVQENLVPMGEARKAVKQVLEPLRELLDQMPKAAAAKVNPADPVHGEEGIREHLDGIFRTMEKRLGDE